MKQLRQALCILLLAVVVGAAAFHFRVDYLANRPVPASLLASENRSSTRLYFAYGANMSKRYLYNARGVLPVQSEPGLIENYEVTFLPSGLNSIEPAFAYLIKAEKMKAYGVLHRLTDTDLVRVKESEGELYQWATLPVKLSNGEIVLAQTLVRLSGGQVAAPSRRYLQILAEGAAEHGLPKDYVTKLRGMPSVYVPIASELMGDLIETTVMSRSGKCPSVLTC